MNRQQIFARLSQPSPSPGKRWRLGVLQDPAPERKEGCLLSWRMRQHGAVLLALDLFAQVPEGINQQLEYRALKEVHKADLENMANAAVNAPEKPVEVRQRDKCMEAQQLKGHWQQLVKGNHVTDLDVFRCALFHLGLSPARSPAWLREHPRRPVKTEYSKRMQQYKQLKKPARETFLQKLTAGQMVAAANCYLTKSRPSNCPTLAFFSAQKSKFLNVTVSCAEQAHFDAVVLKTGEKVVLQGIRRALGGRWVNYTRKKLLRGMSFEVLLIAVVQHLDGREEQMKNDTHMRKAHAKQVRGPCGC